ncbi:MAG: HD domain-containing protein [Verrucomicrobia bacterium]|nr:HD domain-containing protein [Verrucomicrobiota bacterium]
MRRIVFSLLAASMATCGLGHANEERPQVVLSQDALEESFSSARAYLAELTHQDAVVMKNLEDFLGVLSVAYNKEKSLTAGEIQEICDAIEFAADKHRFQTRKNVAKTPYISHPIGVAYNVAKIGKVRDSAVLIAALLHDTLEDTQTTEAEIEELYGVAVLGYVKELTDDKSLSFEERKRAQVISAPNKSKGAAQIKLADKLYNLNDLFNSAPEGWSKARVDRYWQWAQSVVSRLPPANDQLTDAIDELIERYLEKEKA